MGILRDFQDGKMDALRSITYAETGTEAPYIIKNIKNPPDEYSQLSRRIDDTSRIAQMLVDKPGLKYLANKGILLQVDVDKKIEQYKTQGKTTGGAILRQLGKTGVTLTQIVGSTLAQVPVNGTGTHFLEGFRTNTYLQDNGSYSDFENYFGASGVEGAPKALQGKPIKVNKTVDGSVGPARDTTAKPGDIGFSQVGVVGDVFENTLKEVKPFEESTLYIENTESDLELRISNSRTASEFQSTLELTNPDKMSEVSQQRNTTLEENPLHEDIERVTKLIDYRDLDEKGYRSNTYVLDYNSKTINKESRVHLGNPGKRKTFIKNDYTTYLDQFGNPIDKESKLQYIDGINVLDIQDERLDGTDKGRDLIKFRFEIITPEESKFLYFRAYLTSFTDNYAGSWNSTKYLGRAESLKTYQGFERGIDLGFTISAASRDEMKPLYRKMVYLASSTAPTYTNINNFMRGTIVRLTVGDYLYEIPGIIESVNYTWQKDYAWEIAMQNPDGGTDDDMQELPQTMDCSISFKPIHDFIPQTGLNPLITNIRPIGNKKPFIENAETL